MLCPYCRHDNIAGADYCLHCGHDLMGYDVNLRYEPSFREGLARRILEYTISDLGVRPALSLPLTATAREAVDMLRDSKAGALIVTDESGKMVAIFTERDVLIRCAHRPGELDSVLLSEVMSPDPIVLDETDTIALALNRIYFGGLRHIPVELPGGTWGMLTVNDVLMFINTHAARGAAPG